MSEGAGASQPAGVVDAEAPARVAPPRPWFTRLHWRLGMLHAVFVFLLLGAIGVILARVIRADEVARSAAVGSAVLDAAVSAVRSRLASDRDVGEALARISDATGVELGLFDRQGDPVWFDGPADPVRDEVLQAVRAGEGIETRQHGGMEQVCMARRFAATAGEFVARACLPMETEAGTARGALRAMWGLLALTGVLLVGAGVLVARPVARSLDGFASALRATAAEGDASSGGVAGGAALDDLNRAFRDLRRALAERERRNRDTARMLDAVVAGGVEGVLVVDGRLRVVLASPRAVELLGPDSGGGALPVQGASLTELGRSPALTELVEQSIESGRTLQSEIAPGGSPSRVLLVRAAPLALEGQSPGAVVVLGDLTRLRRLERVRRDFVANVSHELRTPVAAISGWAELLQTREEPLPADVGEAVAVIARHAERLRALLDDLLTLARVESDAVRARPEEVEIAALLSQLVDALREKCEARRVRIRTAVQPADLLFVTDPALFSIAVGNLLDNAVKYSPPDSFVDVRAGLIGDGALSVEVCDRGAGIEAHHLPRIFERFYRADAGAAGRSEGGTGLGLSIVRHSVQALSGSVEARSEYGRGSTFSVRLPMIPATPGGRSPD